MDTLNTPSVQLQETSEVQSVKEKLIELLIEKSRTSPSAGSCSGDICITCFTP